MLMSIYTISAVYKVSIQHTLWCCLTVINVTSQYSQPLARTGLELIALLQ